MADRALGVGHVKALAPGLDEGGDDLRRVLQIGIDDNHRLAAGGVVEACGEGDFLAEIAAEIDHRHPGVGRLGLEHQGQRAIARAIIHIDQLEGQADALHRRGDAGVEFGQHLLLIVAGDDD